MTKTVMPTIKRRRRDPAAYKIQLAYHQHMNIKRLFSFNASSLGDGINGWVVPQGEASWRGGGKNHLPFVGSITSLASLGVRVNGGGSSNSERCVLCVVLAYAALLVLAGARATPRRAALRRVAERRRGRGGCCAPRGAPLLRRCAALAVCYFTLLASGSPATLRDLPGERR